MRGRRHASMVLITATNRLPLTPISTQPNAMPRNRLTLTLSLAATAVAAPAAHADSISYVKNGNVYLTSTDGSQTAQVTTAGGYSSASQADDGRIIALKGGRFHLINRWGDVLADFSPVAPGTAGSITLSGPYDPAISPDGTKVAYGFYVQYKTGDPNCGKPGGCMQGQLYTGTGYAASDHGVEWSADGYRPQYSWTDPSWIDNQRTLISAPTSGFVKESAIDTAGDGQDAAGWFSDDSIGNLYDGEMNRQQSAAAFVGNTESNRLLVYRTPAAPPADPERCLDAPTQGRWQSPSWSPNGTHLAWAGPQGIYVADLSGITAACPDASKVTVTAFAPGATSPDWGPADLPGPKPQTTPAPSPNATPIPNATSQPQTTPSPDGPRAGTMIKALTTSRAAAVRRGLKVSVQCTTGKLDIRATLGATLVASGQVRCNGSARTTTLALSKAGRRRLKTIRKPVLQLRAGEAAASVTLR